MVAPTSLNRLDALVQMSFAIQGLLERRAAEEGLSIIQTRLLGVLRDREPTINELSALLGLDKSSVSGLVARAQRRGLVARRPSLADRRSVRVQLTAKGRGCVEVVVGQLEEDLVGLLAPLEPREQETLRSLLSRVLMEHAVAAPVTPIAPWSGEPGPA